MQCTCLPAGIHGLIVMHTEYCLWLWPKGTGGDYAAVHRAILLLNARNGQTQNENTKFKGQMCSLPFSATFRVNILLSTLLR